MNDAPAKEYKSRARLYLNAPFQKDGTIALSKDQAHYLTHVLRLAPGEAIAVFNGQDGEWRAEATAKNQLTLREKLRDQNPEPDLWLLFAPIKKDGTDFILQKATELGVSAIQPVFCDRSNTRRLNDERAEANLIEAAEQCERLSIPQLKPSTDLREALQSWPHDRILIFCDEMREARPLGELLQDLKGQKLALLIGPEGGFSATERADLQQRGFVRPAHLGPRILRAETAALAGLSVIQALGGDWKNKF